MHRADEDMNANLAAYHERRAAYFAAQGNAEKAAQQAALAAIYRRRAEQVR